MRTERLFGMLVLLLAGCASIDAYFDRRDWHYDGFEVATYTWEVTEDYKKCGLPPMAWGSHWGCAIRAFAPVPQNGAKPVPHTIAKDGHCFIFSNVPEDEAVRLNAGDDNLRDHELRHCRGWVHPR